MSCLDSDIMNNVFTVSLTVQSFARILCDYAIEMTVDKLRKSAGGLSKITEKNSVKDRWMRINHIMGALKDKLDDFIRKRTSCHVDFGEKRMKATEQDVEVLVDTLIERVPSPWGKEQGTANIVRGIKCVKFKTIII